MPISTAVSTRNSSFVMYRNIVTFQERTKGRVADIQLHGGRESLRPKVLRPSGHVAADHLQFRAGNSDMQASLRQPESLLGL